MSTELHGSGLPEPFTIEVLHPSPGVTVVAVGGEIDIATAPELSRRLESLDGAAPLAVIVDLSASTFLDSSGIRALLVAGREIESRGGTVALAAAQPHVQRVIDAMHLGDVIAVEPSLESAVTNIRAARG